MTTTTDARGDVRDAGSYYLRNTTAAAVGRDVVPNYSADVLSMNMTTAGSPGSRQLYLHTGTDYDRPLKWSTYSSWSGV